MSEHDVVPHWRGDTTLLTRLRAGDEAAFDMLVQTYGSALIRYAASMVGSIDVAQDVVQDVFLSLWQGRSRIENSWDIAAYLYGSTRQRALKFVRAAQARTQREDRWAVQQHVETDTSVAIDVSGNEADDVRMQVWNALAGVSPRCREVFMLVWDDELPYIEIARRMGLAEPTVRSYVSRALKQLIDVLRPKYRS